MRSPAELVREFHEAFGRVIRDTPTLPPFEEEEMRLALIEEECEEYREAVYSHASDDHRHIVGVVSELADIVYVAYGAALHYGVDLDAVIAETHAANMRKRFPDGSVHYREDGKVLKPEGWQRADIKGVLGL